MISSLKDSIEDLFSYIPESKKSFINIDSILDALDTIDRSSLQLQEENKSLHTEVQSLMEQNEFQNKFVLSLTEYADENAHNDSDSSVEYLSSSDTYEYDDYDYNNASDDNISTIDVDDLVQTFIRASEERESEIKQLSQQNSKIVNAFEELFGDEFSDVLDDAELENLQLRQQIAQLQKDLERTKKYLTYTVTELSNAFDFKEKVNLEVNNPTYEDYIQHLIQHIQDSKIHTKDSALKDKYNALAKKYKQIRADNNRARCVLTKLSGEDASKGNLDDFIARTCTKVVKLAAQEANKRFFTPLENINQRAEETMQQVLDTTAKLSQLQLAVTLVYLGKKDSVASEKKNARALFDAIFPQAMNINEESDNNFVEEKIDELKQSVIELAKEAGSRIPVGSILSQLNALRCSLVVKGSLAI